MLLAKPPQSSATELRALGVLAAPLVGANLLQMAVYAVDVIFVARLGPVEFAAATLGVFLYSLFLWSLISLTTACAPVMAAELGRRRNAVREVRRSFRMALWLSVIAGAPFVVLLAFGETILRLAGQDPEVAAHAGAFLDILLFALIPSVLAANMRTAAATLGRPNWALAVTALALVVGIVANWAFVFGHLGFPALGLEGSAIASLVNVAVLVIAYSVILLLDPRLRRFRLFGNWWRSEWSRLGEIVRIGLPIAATATLEIALFGGAALLMGLIGVTEVAAHAIAINIASIAFQIPFGIGQAATIRVGMAYGANDREWMTRAGWVAITVGAAFMLMTASFLWLFPRLFIGVYIDVAAPANARIVGLAVQYLAIAAMFQLFDGVQAVAAGVLRGLQDTRVPMIIAGLGYWAIGFVTSIALGFGLGWEGVGIWAGLAAGLAAVSALLLWRWARRERLRLTGLAAHALRQRRSWARLKFVRRVG